MNRGKLYIVAGPIGNLEDTTYRAIRVLKEVDLILSEDTRETDKLLKRFELNTPQVSYRDQNHERVFSFIKEALEAGRSLALVSDSGTPLISDPGYKLVRDLRLMGFEVISVPGPSAVISALSVSGLPTDKFIFLGFLSKSDSQRKEILHKYGSFDATLTIYESPYRVIRLLSEISEALGNRYVCLAKDLTKAFEDVKTGFVDDLLSNGDIKEKGEYVILVAKEGFLGDSNGSADTSPRKDTFRPNTT